MVLHYGHTVSEISEMWETEYVSTENKGPAAPTTGSPDWWHERLGPVALQPGVGRPSLREEDILDSALKLIDEGGSAAFSFRGLAKALGSSTATLYRHFSGKEELIVCVVDRALGEVAEGAPTERPDLSWNSLRSTARNLFGFFERHPHLVSLVGNTIPLGPNGLLLRERVLALLISEGIPAEEAGRAYTAIARYVIGFSAQLASSSELSAGELRELRSYFSALDPDRYPVTTSLADLIPGALRDEFEFGLGLLLEGLNHRRRK